MRLTLRTLLAYMDEMLEPNDAAAIRERLDQNEQAGAILHRVRDVVRRLRIGAPKPNERGLAGDANNVADYLDNTMSPAKVADFERACLESDVHLAEVAGCHQILSLVLREKADVDPDLRQQMYDLIERATTPVPAVHKLDTVLQGSGTATVDSSAIEPVAVAEAVDEPPAQPVPLVARAERRVEVPDYLREERQSQWWPLVAATVLLGALVGALYLAVAGPSITDLFNGSQVARGPDGKDSPASGEVTEKAPDAEGAAPETATTDTPDAQTPPATSAPPIAAVPNVPVEAEVPATEAPPAATGSDATPPATESAPAEPPVPGEKPAAPVATTENETPVEPGPSAVPLEPSDAAPPAAAAVVAARLTKDDALLLRFDRAAPGWRRVMSSEEIHSDEQLLVMPVYRPVLQLQSGLILEVVGPTDLTLLAPNGEGVEGLSLKYGQVKMLAGGHAGARLRIVVGEREAQLTFVNEESVAAVDLGLFRNPGDDPEQVRALDVIGVYAVSGKIEMTPPGGTEQPQTFVGPKLIVTPSLPSGPVASALPAWISTETSALIDRRAAKEIAEQVTGDRSITLTLKEAADVPQIEIRALAARCLCQISEFDAALALLADRDAKSFWDGLAMSLVASTCRSPADTQRVSEAFARQFGATGKQSYRLLWGYSNEQLAGGADRELVEALESDDLCVRRLAIWNLAGITGSTMYYQPEQSPKSRQQAMQKWRAKLKKGEIRYGEGPSEEPTVEGESGL